MELPAMIVKTFKTKLYNNIIYQIPEGGLFYNAFFRE